jgi:Cupin-like domain
MTVIATHSLVDVRPDLTVEEFYAEYVNRKPVLLRGALAHLPATEKWNIDYFASLAPRLPVRLKTGTVARGVTAMVPLEEYRATVAAWEREVAAGTACTPPPAYLHDVPLLRLIPGLRKDLEPFPAHMFPKFFRDRWWEFPQFFVGPSRACTPLHFDTLLTHNLFFQFEGRKRFLMVDNAYRDRCYTYNWRWSNVDPDRPDPVQQPLFEGVPLMECEVGAGDLFYMPPGTLHKVTSLNASVSFNIDWHDRKSALRGLTAVRHGMPVPNLRYNLLFALGVWGGVPLKALMPALGSYFTYIS